MTMKTLRRYHVLLERNDLGGYTVTVPVLPAVVTQGDTREQALANAADAIRIYVESLQGRGLPIPEDTGAILEEVAVTIELHQRGLTEESYPPSGQSTEEWLNEWLRLGEQTLHEAPPGPTSTEILSADRGRLDSRS